MSMTGSNPPASEAGPRRFDLAIIGGGIVGMGTAMALARDYRLSLVVVEAENELAFHQTGHNSGVIHSGLYYKPGSLKARLCAEGREEMYRFCAEHGVPHERCGKVVVATRQEELPALETLRRRGTANGLASLRTLSIEEVRQIEPHVAGIAGLHVRETGIIDFPAAARAMASLVQQRGGEVRCGWKVQAVRRRADRLILETAGGTVECGAIINCGGLQCDRVARLCGMDPGLKIVPFRGEYYKLSPSASGRVRNLIYPVPDPRFPFLGVHFTRMVHGGVEAGPNAVLALHRQGYSKFSFRPADAWETLTFGGFWRMARKYWWTGCGEMYRSISQRAFLMALQRLMPALKFADLRPGGSGIRAQAVENSGALVDDFRILEADRMIHVLNAPSPAATASIAIGRYIARLAAERLGLPAW